MMKHNQNENARLVTNDNEEQDRKKNEQAVENVRAKSQGRLSNRRDALKLKQYTAHAMKCESTIKTVNA
jgi:hypothetical protein